MSNGSDRESRLLASLPSNERERLAPHLTDVALPFGQQLARPGYAPERVFFVRSGMVSMVVTLEDGRSVESVEMGDEGIAGLDAVLGDGVAFAETVVQTEGEAWAMATTMLRSMLPELPVLSRRLGNLARLSLQQAMQTAACNAYHPVGGRLARWFLIVRNILGRDEFFLTHEFIADMLAAHRPTLTLAAIELRDAGAITYQRGHVEVIDAERLEMHSCECFSVLHRAREEYLASLNNQ